MRLEEHIHRVGHLDNLAVHEAQTLVVVEDSVHVLDPLGVDRPVKHDPTPLKVWFVVRAVSEDGAKDTIRELLRNCVIVAVQLG